MPFPSTLSSFTNPTATQKLNSPSHSSIESFQNDAIKQVETIIGTDASTLGTLIGDLRSASSSGGGHVQAANKGGTGQTAYAKGDMLIAQSASVLSKLVVGTDGQIVKADSSVATGVKWADSTSPKIAASATSIVTLVSTVAEQSVLSVSIPGSVFGTNNAVRAILDVGEFASESISSVLLKANLGSASPAASVMLRPAGGLAGLIGKIEILVVGNGATNAQRVNLSVDLAEEKAVFSSVAVATRKFDSGTAAQDSNASMILGLTSRVGDSGATNKLKITTYVVEKIT